MKYQNALSEKQLATEDLSKALQKKIESVEKLEAKIENADLTEEQISKIELEIENLDNSLEKAINKFNPEVHKERLDRIAEINKRKSENVDEEYEEEEEVVVTKQPAPPKKVEKVEAKVNTGNIKKINAKLDELKRSVEIDSSKLEKEIIEEAETETEEIEDFQSTGERKPKKVSFGFALLCAGAFLMTWGGINLYRSRR
jgi:hypothetical protein